MTRNHLVERDVTAELLKDLLILELAKAGVTQRQIRKALNCDANRVTRIAGPVKKARDRSQLQ